MNQDVVSTITNAVWNESGSLDITSLTSAVHFISTAVDELRQAPKERVGLLNMLLWKQFGDSIDIYIQDNILKGFSSKRHFQKEEELYHVLDWHHLYYSSFMKAFVQLMKVKLSELSASKGSDETVSADFDEWFDDGLLSYARRCCGGALSGRHVGELRLAATAQIALGRSKFLFEMVAEYPDSLVGLKELRDCLKRSDMVSEVGKRFRIALQKRLLHMGASTTQILDFYVSMIKALRILDPSDFLLNYVAAPVRKYLLSRKDAVRCIVASLTEGRESELHGELKQGGNLAYAPDEDDEEAGPGAHWEPRRRNKELVEPSGKADAASSKGLDTLALLVSIYGSTDLFIVEYRSLLADKLIANVGYATDSEVANLELLKIRFGEESLHSCEVMLKDVEDSKRVNNAVHSELARAPAPSSSGKITSNHSKAVDYVIVSEHYWPSMPRDTMAYHAQAASLLESYQGAYAGLKKPRSLHPAHTLGQVDLELDFDDGSSRTFTVNPMQANVILHFQEAEDRSDGSTTLSLRQLASLCEVEEDELFTSGIAYWLSKGVLREISAGTGPSKSTSSGYDDYAEGPDRLFEVVEAQRGLASADLSMEGSGGAVGGVQESKLSSAAGAEQKAVLIQIEGYIKGLLSGPGNSSMSLERLHGMLRLLSGGGGTGGGAGDLRFDMSAQQLRQFLAGLVDAGKIEYMEGVYALCQPVAPTSGSS